MRGRKPIPSPLNNLHGNPGRRRKPAVEMKAPAATVIPPPAHLSPAAAAEWTRMVEQLKASAILTALDYGLLEAWCSARGDFIAASEALNRDGLVIVDRDGTARRNPWVLIKTKAVEQLQRIGGEFGFSPASRPRLGRSAAADDHDVHDDEFDAFLATDPDNPANAKGRRARH